jgi:hypothetical protein
LVSRLDPRKYPHFFVIRRLVVWFTGCLLDSC